MLSPNRLGCVSSVGCKTGPPISKAHLCSWLARSALLTAKRAPLMLEHASFMTGLLRSSCYRMDPSDLKPAFHRSCGLSCFGGSSRTWSEGCPQRKRRSSRSGCRRCRRRTTRPCCRRTLTSSTVSNRFQPWKPDGLWGDLLTCECSNPSEALHRLRATKSMPVWSSLCRQPEVRT
jgi:hypothetical protein